MNKTMTHIQRNTWWKATEVLGSYSIYIAHSYLLFLYTNSHFLGKISTLYGAIFFLASCLRLGFEGVAATNFAYWSCSRSNFTHFFIRQAVPTIAFAFIFALLISTQLYHYVSWSEYFLCFSLLLFELSRKIIKTFLNLLLENKKTAAIEITQMIGFTTLVWIPWAIVGQLTISTILLAHLSMLIATVTAYLFLLHSWYQTVPSTTTHVPYIDSSRLYLSISQLIQQCCSTNAFVLLIASYSGIVVAGECYLIANILYTCITIIERISGSVFLAHFSRTTHSPAQSPFNHTVLMSIICISCITLIATRQTLTMSLITGIAALIILEYALNYFEKKAITNNNALPLLINAVGLAIAIASLGYVTPHPTVLIGSLLAIRVLSLILLLLTQKSYPKKQQIF